MENYKHILLAVDFYEHCEAVAVKLEDSIVERITGEVGVIN